MIPKKIHYVWLGRGEKDERTKHCIETWKKFLPDYEIKEWNEDNLPIDQLGDFSVYHQSYFFTKDEGYTWHSFNGSW